MKRTPFFDVLNSYGGKFVDFAGFEMPVQFDGILHEHKAVRENVGLFDVSHMGEVMLSGKGAFDTVQHLFTNDYTTLKEGRVRYSLMLNEDGCVIDDVLVYCVNSEKYVVCVNASNVDKDFKWISSHVLPDTVAENLSDETAQLAVQGPNAEKVIRKIFKDEDVPEKYYSFKTVDGVLSSVLMLSRTGYTAEDGFEIYCNVKDAMKLFDLVTDAGKEFDMALCGLGARDTLRLEGAMPLYGHEMGEDILASEIGLNMFIKTDKPDFIGKTALIEKNPAKQRLGIELVDRGIAREHSDVYAGDKLVGYVTSGTMSPTLNKAIAMIRIDRDADLSDLSVDVRGRRLKAKVVPLPFYKRQK